MTVIGQPGLGDGIQWLVLHLGFGWLFHGRYRLVKESGIE